VSKSYNDYLREERRLVILRLLHETSGYAANSSILAAGLAHIGVPASRDQVHGELDWLAEQGLLTQEDLGIGVRVATITARGGDVAQGLAIVSGVKRPSPR
jgi:Fe2+ or Zn2+ uptake regulation protein